MSKLPYIAGTMLVIAKQLDHVQIASPDGNAQRSGTLQGQGKVSVAVQISFMPAER